jgi:hypothetical protein
VVLKGRKGSRTDNLVREDGSSGPIERGATRLREGVKIGCSNGITYVDFVRKYLHRLGIWKFVLLAVDIMLTRCKMNGEKQCIA